MKYCILGGGGSFGLHVAKYLLALPGTERVLSIGRAPPKPPCFRIGNFDCDPRYAYVPLHITYHHSQVMHLLNFEKPDVIINFAAQGEGATSFTESWRYFETNCVGLSKLVERLAGLDWLKRFIHISTSELYGPTDSPVDENGYCESVDHLDSPGPTSPYAISKLAFDQYLGLMSDRGFPATIVRPSNCYGEGQQLHRFIPKAFLYGLTGRKVPLHGGGKAEKSYIHSEDLARAIYMLIDAPGGIYNVGPRDPMPMHAIAGMVAETLHMPRDQLCDVSAPDRDHQDARYWLDSSKIRSLGWFPTVEWSDGLTRVRNWIISNLDELMKQPVDFVMRP